MLVQVIGLDQGPRSRTGKTSTKFEYVDERGTQGEILVWRANEIRGVSVGDWVNLETSQNGQYTNIKSVTPAAAPANVSPAVTSAVADSAYQRQKHPDEQRSIARSVELAQAVALEASKGGKSPKIEEVLHNAETFVQWLLEEDEVPELNQPDIPE